MHTILITVPVQKDKKQELLDLIRSPIGHPFTKKLTKVSSLQRVGSQRMKKVMLSGICGKHGKTKKTSTTTMLLLKEWKEANL